MQKYTNSFCYYCGNPSSSIEHAPPQMFFRKFSCDSITAPSCEAHNRDKSNDDQVFVSSMIHSLNDLQAEQGVEFLPDVMKAIEVAKSSFKRTKNRIKKVDVLEDGKLGDSDLPKITYFQGNISEWMKQLTAVLVWDAIHKYDDTLDWSKANVKSPDLILSYILRESLNLEELIETKDEFEQVSELEQRLPWINGWSADPKPYPLSIYSFSLYFDHAGGSVIIRHKFYNVFRLYVMFSASIETIAALERRVFSYNTKHFRT